MKKVLKFKGDPSWHDANQAWDDMPEAEAILTDIKILQPAEPRFGKREFWIGWKRSEIYGQDVPFVLTETPHWLEESTIHVIEYAAYVEAKNGK